MVAISGNTYPVRDQIKALGGRWNSETKTWSVPDDKAEEARKLAGGSNSSASPPPPHKHRGQCQCTEQGCCRPRCYCSKSCACKGGPIFDCMG